MLQIHPDKVCYIIVNAKEFQAREDTSLSEAGAGDDDPRNILLADPDDPTFEETAGFIDSLSDDEQAELVALAWLGREDYTVAEWGEALEAAVDRHTGSTAEYLLGLPLLPGYLENGLNQFGYSCDDL